MANKCPQKYAPGESRPAAWLDIVPTADPKHPQRIYKSLYPSILEELDSYHSVCDYTFAKWAAADQTKPALIQAETKQQFTYPQLRQLTHKVACILYHSYGIRKGDVVSIVSNNNIYYPAMSYGILELGATISAANPSNTPETLAPVIEIAHAKSIITFHKSRQLIGSTIELVKRHTGKDLTVFFMDGIEDIEVDEIPEDYTALQDAKPEDVAFLPLSSGTTGTPKGVQLTNYCLLAELLQLRPLSAYENETFLTVLPFFHIYGFIVCMSALLDAGATQLIMSAFNTAAYVDNLLTYKVNGIFVVPPMVNALVHRLEAMGGEADLSSLVYCFCGSSPLSLEMASRFMTCAPNMVLGQAWGMTELSGAVTMMPRDNPAITFDVCGSLMADCEMRIISVEASQQSGADKSSGIDVEEGEVGEIWVRGPTLMKGYLKEEDTAICMQDGWYRTGDMGYIVPCTNAMVMTDRLKELIKYKGFQLSPVTVELVLMKHPWVRDCIVLGVPDPADPSFEQPRALVELKNNLTVSQRVAASDELYRYIMKKMPPNMRLHGGVRIVPEIPRNATGKLNRRQTRHAEMEFCETANLANIED